MRASLRSSTSPAGTRWRRSRSIIAEHKIEWPEIYLGENWKDDIAKQYGDPVASYILLVDPEGKIVATWLRGEKLTQTVKDAIGKTG